MRNSGADLSFRCLPNDWPADFGRLIAKEGERWGKVIRFADIKAS